MNATASLFDPSARLVQGLRARARQYMAGADARTNPYSFLRAVLVDERNRSIPVDTFTRIFMDSWLYCWGTRGRSGRRHFAFTSPPGLGKSTLARMAALFALGGDKSLRIAALSGSVPDATNTVSLCREIVIGQSFQTLFPGHRPDMNESTTGRGWKQSEWFLESDGQRKDPTMRAMSSTPKMESARIDLLLADDIITERTWDNSEGRAIANAFKKTFIEGRLRLGGVALYLQNLRGKGDLLHQLREWDKFVSVWVGVTADCERMFLKIWNAPEDFPILQDPEAYGLTETNNPDADEVNPSLYAEFPLPDRPGYSRRDLSETDPESFQTMFRLKGIDPEGLMIPAFMKTEKDPRPVWQMMGCEEEAGLPVIPARERFRFRIVAGLDISGLKRKGTAFCALAQDSQGYRYPLEMWRVNGAIDKTVVARIGDSFRRLGIEALLVESNGVQDQVRELIRELVRAQGDDWHHQIMSFVTGANKWDPQMGLPGLNIKFSQGVYRWPTMAMLKPFESAVAVLTREVTRDTTPDELMAFWFADSGLDRMGTPGSRKAPQLVPITTKNEWGF